MGIDGLCVVSNWTRNHAYILLVVLIASGAVGAAHRIACPVFKQQEVASGVGGVIGANGDAGGSGGIEDESSWASLDASPHSGGIGGGSFVVAEVVFGAITCA